MSNKKTLEEFKREVFNVFGGNAEVIGDYINNKTKILVKFNCCGNEEYKIPTKLLIGQGCSKCTGKRISKSKTKTTEQYKKDLLLKGIDYIEFDGSHHFKGTKTKFRTSKVKLHDEIKNNYCKNHNIELLRIPYWWLRNDRITKELDKFILNK